MDSKRNGEELVQIFVDADACPVVGIIETMAEKYKMCIRDSYVTGTAQPKMNQEKMNSILIPIPPTGEQFRIVQKINQIFSVIANM